MVSSELCASSLSSVKYPAKADLVRFVQRWRLGRFQGQSPGVRACGATHSVLLLTIDPGGRRSQGEEASRSAGAGIQPAAAGWKRRQVLVSIGRAPAGLRDLIFVACTFDFFPLCFCSNCIKVCWSTRKSFESLQPDRARVWTTFPAACLARCWAPSRS